MSVHFAPIRHIPQINLDPEAALPTASQPGFGQIFQNAVDKVDGYQKQAEQSIESFLKGETQEVHNVILDTQRAELAFDFALEVRNKAVQAYQEIMRMQV